MTIISPNSISGITSVTAKTTDQLKLFDVNGAWSHVRVGVITATKFVGPITGDVTGNLTGAATQLATNATGANLTLSGDLGVAGTLTYEDVARIDAVGLSTFREGFGVGPLAGIALTAYKDGSVRTSGIVTAASFHGDFVGDGSGLTGAGPSLANGVNDRVVTASSATALNGEANLTFNGSTLGVTGDALISNSGGNAKLKIKRSNTASNSDDYGSILFQSSADNNNVSIGAARESAENDAYLFFSTASGGSLAERLRITKDGHLLPPSSNSQDLGSVSKRWRDLYTQDLQLSNKSVEGGNDVDGTWGDYTIQEGENDLFLINNRNGKKYKFNLTEVN